jgi:hypothetical protein
MNTCQATIAFFACIACTTAGSTRLQAIRNQDRHVNHMAIICHRLASRCFNIVNFILQVNPGIAVQLRKIELLYDFICFDL